MKQDVSQTPSPSGDLVGAPVLAVTPDQLGSQVRNIDALQERAMKLELRLSDLNVQLSQLRDRRDRAATDADRQRFDKQLADGQHDMAAASIELAGLQKKITQLESSLNPQTAFTIAPPPPPPSLPLGPELNSEQIMQIVGGAGMLLIPLVLVLARNLWIRGTRKTESVDIESSPRLQRIEQAIEAIAVEVERIGEGQRFSTKLLSERQPDALANRAAIPVSRREPGTITPH